MEAATQTGKICLILDKSFFNSLNYEEINLLHQYYWINITPVLIYEILGDLQKEKEGKSLNDEKVIEFAKKLHPINSSINTFYSKLIEAELMGELVIPFDNPVVLYGKEMQLDNGMKGTYFPLSEQQIAINRWKEGDFTMEEKMFSTQWRQFTTQQDNLTKIKKDFQTNLSIFKGLKTQQEILAMFDDFVKDPGWHAFLVELIIEEFSISADKASSIFYRWETEGRNNLAAFAPYSLFCLRANFLFKICLQNDLINTRPTNWLDLHYVYYLPFCHVFLSNDKLHDRIVPFLLRDHQRYIKGVDMKKDLQQILILKKQLTGKELARSHREPPHIPALLSYQLWQDMYSDWPSASDWKPDKAFRDLMETITENLKFNEEDLINRQVGKVSNDNPVEGFIQTVIKMTGLPPAKEQLDDFKIFLEKSRIEREDMLRFMNPFYDQLTLKDTKESRGKRSELIDLCQFIFTWEEYTEISIISLGEGPDFTIRYQDELVGVEHTGIFDDEVIAQIGAIRKILMKCELRLTEENIVKGLFNITIEPAYLPENYSRQQDSLIDIICETITTLYNGKLITPSPFIIDVSYVWLDNIQLVLFEDYWLKQLRSENISRCIQKKEQKIEKYKSNNNLSKCWLLIVIGGATAASSFQIPADGLQLPKTTFEKVFIFDAFKKMIVLEK